MNIQTILENKVKEAVSKIFNAELPAVEFHAHYTKLKKPLNVLQEATFLNEYLD